MMLILVICTVAKRQYKSTECLQFCIHFHKNAVTDDISKNRLYLHAHTHFSLLTCISTTLPLLLGLRDHS